MMKKKTVTLSENNLKELEKETGKIGIGLSELLRRIIDDYFKK
jgi:hypothetical protein